MTNKKRRSPIHAYKRLLADDHDWDYSYLIALEKKKLQRMHDYMKHEAHFENSKHVVRELAICIRLIDIFMEDDAAYNTWLDRSYSGTRLKFRKLDDGNYELDDEERKPLADFSVYVNTKNEHRFLRHAPIKAALSEGDRNKAIHSIVCLRQQKALHLYHLIREYKLFGWWN